jgi:hypothetical protein
MLLVLVYIVKHQNVTCSCHYLIRMLLVLVILQEQETFGCFTLYTRTSNIRMFYNIHKNKKHSDVLQYTQEQVTFGCFTIYTRTRNILLVLVILSSECYLFLSLSHPNVTCSCPSLIRMLLVLVIISDNDKNK